MTFADGGDTTAEVARMLRAATGRLATARAAGVLLALVVVASLFVPPLLGLERFGDVVAFAGIAAALVWVFLGVSAARLGRQVREASALANLGRPDLAEGRARETLESFCLLRPVTLGAAAVLARVRRDQGRHAEAARLATFVLGRRERPLAGERRTLRLLLADALLELGDARGATNAVLPLYAPADKSSDRLTLADALRLLTVQMRIDAACDAWAGLHAGRGRTLPMVELMDADDLVRSTAILLRAADEAGDTPLAALLARRVTLLADAATLEARERTLAGRLHGLLQRHDPLYQSNADAGEAA